MLEYIGLGWLPNLLYNLGKDIFGVVSRKWWKLDGGVISG